MVTCPATCSGSWALICPGDANNIGIAVPFAVRQDWPRAVGNGISLVAILVGLRLAPNTVIKDPGAKRSVKSAAFPTRWMEGGATAESKFQAKAVKPEAERAISVFRLASGASARVKTEAALGASGCSATRVGRMRSPVPRSMRSIKPHKAAVPVSRTPRPSTKAKPAVGVSPSQEGEGTSDPLTRRLPARNEPESDAA